MNQRQGGWQPELAAGEVSAQTVAGMQEELEQVGHGADSVSSRSFGQARGRVRQGRGDPALACYRATETSPRPKESP